MLPLFVYSRQLAFIQESFLGMCQILLGVYLKFLADLESAIKRKWIRVEFW